MRTLTKIERSKNGIKYKIDDIEISNPNMFAPVTSFEVKDSRGIRKEALPVVLPNHLGLIIQPSTEEIMAELYRLEIKGNLK